MSIKNSQAITAGSGSAGGGLPAGVANNTLRFNAVTGKWVVAGDLTNDGTNLFATGNLKIGAIGTPALVQLHVEGSGGGFFEKPDAGTTNAVTPLSVGHRTSGNMADGFATNIEFFIEDATSGLITAGTMRAVRDGADNTTKLVFLPYLAGVAVEALTLKSDGGSIFAGPLDIQDNPATFQLGTVTGTGAQTINYNTGNKQQFTFGAGNVTFTFTDPPEACSLVLKIIQDGVGSRTATWPASVKWPGGTAPTLSTGANAVDVIAFFFDGTSYYGTTSLNFS